MADWYISSAGYTAVTAWAATTAYSVGDIRRPTAAKKPARSARKPAKSTKRVAKSTKKASKATKRVAHRRRDVIPAEYQHDP